MPRSRPRATIQAPQPGPAYDVEPGLVRRRLPDALEVALDQVAEDTQQPRRDWETDDGRLRLRELAASIAEFGILQPLLVREDGRLPDGRWRYRVIAGARRRRAAAQAGLKVLPVIVRDEEPARIRVLQLLENLQRQDLLPLDEARAFQELIDIEGLTPRGLAERLHISDQQVRDRLRLLADQVLADAVERRQISATAAREISKLPDEEIQTFRTRVLAGERLQTNDVARARARLAAEGIINPRQTRPAGRIVEQPGAPAPAGQAGAGPAAPEPAGIIPAAAPLQKGIPGAQTSFDPPSAEREGGQEPAAPGAHPASAAATTAERTVVLDTLRIARLLQSYRHTAPYSEVLAALHEDLARLTAEEAKLPAAGS